MHQHQPLHFRFHHFAKRRPEAARLHRHLYFLPPKLPKIPPQRQFLVGHCPRLQNLASCFQRRHVTKSLVKIYANVDHLVPPSGLVLRARTLPLEARLFLFSLHLSGIYPFNCEWVGEVEGPLSSRRPWPELKSSARTE